MKKQNYTNYKHIVPSYHYLTFFAMLCLLAGSIYYLVSNNEPSQLLPFLVFLLVLTVISVSLHSRLFVLRVQDRAIRAEENLRYFILTGKRLNQALTLKQIIALRFAGDEEFVELTERAIKENLAPDQIKRSIKNWKPDYYRA